jgi:hypothetical protein
VDFCLDLPVENWYNLFIPEKTDFAKSGAGEVDI